MYTFGAYEMANEEMSLLTEAMYDWFDSIALDDVTPLCILAWV